MKNESSTDASHLTVRPDLSSTEALAALQQWPITLGFCWQTNGTTSTQRCLVQPATTSQLTSPAVQPSSWIAETLRQRYLAELATRAYPSLGTRERDFLLGRGAVEATAILPAETVVTGSTNGAPQFPSGWHGSIAHTSVAYDFSVAIAGIISSQTGVRLGVDIERRERSVSPELLARISSPHELSAWGQQLEANTLRIGLCSLKEAVFKSLSTASRSNLPWHSIEILPAGDGIHCQLPQQLGVTTSVTLVMAQTGQLLVSLAYAHTH